MVWIWSLFIIIPIVFTWWGWKNVLIPFGIPLVKVLFITIITIIWIGFSFGVMSTTVWYRTFGWNTFTVLADSVPESEWGQHLRWKIENDSTPDGLYKPGWRESRGLPRLPDDWNGEPEHALPWWSATAITAFILFVMYRRYKAKQKEVSGPPVRSWDEINRDIGRISSQYSGPTPPTIESKAKPSKKQQNPTDADLTSALKDLGYKQKDIEEVLKLCQDTDIESRLRSALKILVNK